MLEYSPAGTQADSSGFFRLQHRKAYVELQSILLMLRPYQGGRRVLHRDDIIAQSKNALYKMHILLANQTTLPVAHIRSPKLMDPMPKAAASARFHFVACLLAWSVRSHPKAKAPLGGPKSRALI